MPMGLVPVGQTCNCSPQVGFALMHVTPGLMLTADMGPEYFNFPKRYAFGTGNVHLFFVQNHSDNKPLHLLLGNKFSFMVF